MKKIIPSSSVFNAIDDHLSYYHASERDRLCAENRLYAFLSHREEMYFETLKKISLQGENEVLNLSEEERTNLHAKEALKKVLCDLQDDLYLQFF